MGHRVSHAKNRSNRAFRPNLQTKRIMVEGVSRRARLCANCIKLMRKRELDAQRASVAAMA